MSNSSAGYWERFLGAAECWLARSYLERFEPELLAAVPECGPLTKVAHYLIKAGGRRIRPLVTLAMCDALGGAWTEAVHAAAAVELVHAASLIHDDILDGSEQRRGRSAAHVKFGTALALLTGDMLLFAGVRAAQALPGAVRALNAACSSMCLGEVTEDSVESARLKSGALFRAAAELGGLAAGASEQALESAGRFGEKLGTAYQLRDDELDAQRNECPRRLADQACGELAHLTQSPAKELLLKLTEFAWQRPE